LRDDEGLSPLEHDFKRFPEQSADDVEELVLGLRASPVWQERGDELPLTMVR